MTHTLTQRSMSLESSFASDPYICVIPRGREADPDVAGLGVRFRARLDYKAKFYA